MSEEFQLEPGEERAIEKPSRANRPSADRRADNPAARAGEMERLLSATGLPVLLLDRDMRLLFATETARKILGRGLGGEKPAARIAARLRYPDFARDARRVLARALTLEKEMETRTGGCFLVRLTPQRGAADEVAGVAVTLIDITESRRAEREALASTTYLETALEAMGDAVFISDAQGEIIQFNDAFVAFHRLKDRTECFRALADYPKILDVFASDGGKLPLEDWAIPRALRGETAIGQVYRLRRKDTGAEWIGSFTLAPIRDAAEAIIGAVVTGRDITAQKQTEEDLRDGKRRLRAIVDSAMEAIVTIDRHGIIRSANPATVELYGYEASELIGRNVNLLMPEPDRSRHDSYIANYLRTGEKKIIGKRRKLYGRRKNGELFLKELTITEAPYDGDGLLFVGLMRDLSAEENERRRADQLRDELAHASRLNDMGEVVAALAHELSQPLMAIASFLAAARRKAPTDEFGPVARAIEKAEAQAGRASDILTRLRGFIEKRAPERAPTDLRLLIADAVDLAFPAGRGRAPRVDLRLPEAPMRVNVDRVQIQQVVINLLRNAAEAFDKESKPHIAVEAGVDRPGFLYVSVADNGPGVDVSNAARLFEPFMTTKTRGMGIGLSLCRSIVESHGGKIGFRANLPRGAVFYFTLPILSSRPARKVAESPSVA